MDRKNTPREVVCQHIYPNMFRIVFKTDLRNKFASYLPPNKFRHFRDKQNKMLEKVAKIALFCFEPNVKILSVQYCQLIPRKLAPYVEPVFQEGHFHVGAA